jgi:uncharacterized protein YkwD
MMPKRLIYIFIIFLFILTSSAACSSGIKMSARLDDGNPSLTPFLPKATFTSAAVPMDQDHVAEALPSTPASTEEVEGSSENGEETPPGSPSPTFTEITSTLPVTLTPSATLNPGLPTYTLSPATLTSEPTYPSAPTDTTGPGSTAVPVYTSVPTITSVPTGTPVPSNTPLPTSAPLDTNTPVPTNTAVPAGCSPAGNASYESQVVTLINQERMNRGLSALTLNSSLRTAARRHSEDMACNDFFSHTGSDGSTLSSRVLAAGYSYSWVAENIAASSSCSFSASSVVNMWMNSSGHKANILSTNAVHIGVGFRCVSDGASGDLDAYYTADFGKP